MSLYGFTDSELINGTEWPKSGSTAYAESNLNMLMSYSVFSKHNRKKNITQGL